MYLSFCQPFYLTVQTNTELYDFDEKGLNLDLPLQISATKLFVG